MEILVYHSTICFSFSFQCGERNINDFWNDSPKTMWHYIIKTVSITTKMTLVKPMVQVRRQDYLFENSHWPNEISYNIIIPAT